MRPWYNYKELMSLPISPFVPNIKQIDTPTTNMVLKWLILIALVLFVGFVIIFWFGGTSFSDKDVVLLLDGPAQSAAGDEAVYTLTYRNNTNVDLKDISFTFFYPDDSVVIASESFSQSLTERFIVDKLLPGQEAKREFHAFLIGDKGDVKEARIKAVFNAGSLRSAFEKETSFSSTITSLPVPITLSVPPSAISGQEVNYVLDYRNESGSDIRDIRFEFAFPEGFTVKQTTPNPLQGQTTWEIPLLKQGSGARITVRGTLIGDERDVKEVSVILKRKIQSTYVDYERALSSTIMSSPLLNVSLSVNGSRTYITTIGDQLTYTISFRNVSRYNLIGMTLAAKLDGDMYDLSSVYAGSGFFDIGTRTIVWNAGGVPDFAEFSSGKSGKVEFRVSLKQLLSGAQGTRNFSVKTTATLGTTNVPIGLDGDQVSTQDSIVTKIATQPMLKPVIYYEDPAFGSSGPMPPEIGKETLFTVHWQVINPGNDVSGAMVRGTLPPGVTWKNVMSTGTGQQQPTYDKNKSQVLWDIGFLPQGTGVSSPNYEVSFQVGVTPSPSQRNNFAVIIKDVTLSGTDVYTTQDVTRVIDQITTSDTIDRPDEGMVQ